MYIHICMCVYIYIYMYLYVSDKLHVCTMRCLSAEVEIAASRFAAPRQNLEGYYIHT